MADEWHVYGVLVQICQELRLQTQDAAYNDHFDRWMTRFLAATKQAILTCSTEGDEKSKIPRLIGAAFIKEGNVVRYDAFSREALKRLAWRHFHIGGSKFADLECHLVASLNQDDSDANISVSSLTSTTTSSSKQTGKERAMYWLKVGAGATVGAVAVGLTGGAIVPALAAFIGTTASTAALIAGSAGAAGFAGYKVSRRIGSVDDFCLVPLIQDSESELACLRTVLCCSGWLNSRKDVTSPWRGFSSSPPEQLLAVQFERAELLALGNALRRFVASSVATTASLEVLKRTALAGAAAALVWPLTLLQVGGSLVDNPWSIGLDRARKAGLILAGILAERADCKDAAVTPVSLVGYSLGALVMLECLGELARRGLHGLVHSVLLMGLPCRLNRDTMASARLAVSGRFIHVFSRSDWVLGFLHRTANATFTADIAGMVPISSDGDPRHALLDTIESIDVTGNVKGHMEYAAFASELLDLLDT